MKSCKAPDTCHNVRITERKYSMGQKDMFELRCSSYGGSSDGELLMGIYKEIFTVPEKSL